MARQEVQVNNGMKMGRGAREALAIRGSRAEVAKTKRDIEPGIYARISALLRGKEEEPKKPPTDYEVIFQSKYRTHRIQIDAPADVIDARGRKSMGRTLFCQFRDWTYSIPKFVKPENARFILTTLREHPAFNADFWEQKDLAADLRVAKVAQVVDLLERDKDIKNTVLDYLSERDFVDPLLGDITKEELDGAEAEEAEEAEAQPRRGRRPVVRPAAKRGRRPAASA